MGQLSQALFGILLLWPLALISRSGDDILNNRAISYAFSLVNVIRGEWACRSL